MGSVLKNYPACGDSGSSSDPSSGLNISVNASASPQPISGVSQNSTVAAILALMAARTDLVAGVTTVHVESALDGENLWFKWDGEEFIPILSQLFTVELADFSVASGAVTTVSTLSAPQVRPGDSLSYGYSNSLGGLIVILDALADSVEYRFYNPTASLVSVLAGTLYIRVRS